MSHSHPWHKETLQVERICAIHECGHLKRPLLRWGEGISLKHCHGSSMERFNMRNRSIYWGNHLLCESVRAPSPMPCMGVSRPWDCKVWCVKPQSRSPEECLCWAWWFFVSTHYTQLSLIYMDKLWELRQFGGNSGIRTKHVPERMYGECIW